MTDRNFKPDSGTDLVFEDAGSTDRLRITDGGTTVLYDEGGDIALTIDTAGDVGIGVTPDNFGDYRTLHIKGPTGEGAAIRLQADGDTADSDDAQIYKNSAAFYLRINGTDPLKVYMNSADRMTIDSSGNVNIPGLDASSDVQTDGSKNLTTSSDIRLKNDLGLIDDGLRVIQKLIPHYFSWKSDETAPRQLGFYAQETYKILPEASPRSEKMNLISPEVKARDGVEAQDAVYERAMDENGDPDWNWGFNGRPIIAMLVKAVQELSAKVTTLENA